MKNQWYPIEIYRCDLCDQAACWAHPDGGLRCNDCPRPTSDKERVGFDMGFPKHRIRIKLNG